MNTLRVRKKPWLPFGVALLALPLVAVAFDFFTGARLLSRIGEVVYTSDVDPFELRDAFWASLFAVGGGLMIVWGLRELLFPQTVVRAGLDSLRLGVRGPLRGPSAVPWDDIEDVYALTLDIEGLEIPALAVAVVKRGELTDHPWGARWVAEHTLALDAANWDVPLDEVISQVATIRRAALSPARSESDRGWSAEP